MMPLLAWVAAWVGPGPTAGALWAADQRADGPPGMVWVPGGEFSMGTDDPDSMPNERPAHRVRVGGFWRG